MLKWVLPLAAGLLLSACSDRTEQAKETLLARLAQKRHVEYQNLETFPNGVVCGEVNASDPMRGGSNDFQRFIVWGDMAEDRPSEEDWQVFCTQDQSAALLQTFGIGPVDEPDNQLQQIRSDIAAIETALQAYLDDNYFLPSSEQGLAALVTATTIMPPATRFRPGGYLRAVPADPWGRPYLYERSGLGGIAHSHRVFTLGADGATGGRGKDADVGSEHLKYLAHIAP